MIFDSSQMSVLRKKYQAIPSYDVPEIVLLDRIDEYEGERVKIEELFASVSPEKQKDWFGRLVNKNTQQHIGVWFEIMLFGWLLEYFDVIVEPEILGNHPDFILDGLEKQLVIEARAFLISPEERERRQKFNRIFSSLGSIPQPFSVNLKIKKLGDKIDAVDFVKRVSHWLATEADKTFVYLDKTRNNLSMSATYRPTLKKVGAMSSGGLWVNPDVLKAPLGKKAAQHKALRKAGYPYVISIFLEPTHLSAEEVTEAWFGKTVVVLDTNTDQVVEEKLDESGLHFFGKEITHKSVTGTLVFRVEHDKKNKTRYLRSWYVQNPYANVEIDPVVFPAESRFIVVGQSDKSFEMKWVR